MSTERKSFLLHFDSLGILDKLTKEQAGELFIACRDYNLGEELHLDPILELVFFSFKSQFDRDMEKYQKIVDRNKNNGSKGGRPKNQEEPKEPNGLSVNPNEPKKADSVNDSDSVSGNDSDSKKEVTKDLVVVAPKFNFKNELLALGVDQQVLHDWLIVRKNKKASNTKTALTKIINQAKKAGLSVNDAVSYANGKDWKGFEAQWYLNDAQKANKNVDILQMSSDSNWHLQDQGF